MSARPARASRRRNAVPGPSRASAFGSLPGASVPSRGGVSPWGGSARPRETTKPKLHAAGDSRQPGFERRRASRDRLLCRCVVGERLPEADGQRRLANAERRRADGVMCFHTIHRHVDRRGHRVADPRNETSRADRPDGRTIDPDEARWHLGVITPNAVQIRRHVSSLAPRDDVVRRVAPSRSRSALW